MRSNLIAAVAAAALLVLSPAGAAETGIIEGEVINASTGEPQAGVDVTLTTGTASGEPSTKVVTSDSQGRYRFDSLATGDQYIYALDAVYEEGLFAGRAITIPDDTDETPVIDTTLRVWETTNDPEVIVVGRTDLFIAPNDDGTLGVIEAYQITNTSDRAYVGRGMGSANDAGDPAASLGFPLPDRAREESIQIIESSIDLPELLRTEYGFGITAAVPPDEFTITFGYAVPGTAASYDLSRRALYPTLNFTIFSSGSLDVSTNRLEEKGEVEVGGKSYIEHSTEETLEAGDSIQAVALADAGTPPGLIAGMAGALLLVAALGAFPVWRARRSRRATSSDAAPAATREELMTSIARLDLQRERGDLDEEDWSRRRAAMKAELTRIPADPDSTTDAEGGQR